MSASQHNVGVLIAHLLIQAMIARMNTPSAAITGQDESTAQGAGTHQLLLAGEFVNPTPRPAIQQTSEVQNADITHA